MLPGALKGRVYRTQGWLSPVLLVDGRMEGVWRHEHRGDRLIVGIEPFQKQPGWVRRAAEEEAGRLARARDERQRSLPQRDPGDLASRALNTRPNPAVPSSPSHRCPI